MVLTGAAVGKNFLSAGWLHDLQLHSDQPVPRLPSPLSSPLLGRLAGEERSGSDAFWARFRARSGRLLSARRSISHLLPRVGSLSETAATLFRTRQLGWHAAARHPAT